VATEEVPTANNSLNWRSLCGEGESLLLLERAHCDAVSQPDFLAMAGSRASSRNGVAGHDDQVSNPQTPI
jgi:hypothetical protein